MLDFSFKHFPISCLLLLVWDSFFVVQKKNRNPDETREMPCLPLPGFDVVIGSAEYHQSNFFLAKANVRDF